MRIAIDGRTIVQNRTGVGVYADRLVRSLLQIDPKNEYTLFLVEDDASLSAPNLRKVLITGYDKMGPNRIWENFFLPRFLKTHGVDVYFSPAYLLPILVRSRSRTRTRRTKFVVTIHDLVAFNYPETFTLKMRLWQRLFAGNALRVAERVLADSEATKRDILKFFRVEDKTVTVVHLPIDDCFQAVRDSRILDETRTLFGLPEKFILSVGTLEPRKNVARLAKAYSLLPERTRKEYSLVLAGALGWYSSSIKNEIDQLQLGDQVRFLGYVEQGKLPALYSLATVFAYLSFYEGFGAPPVEAMACGTPVICSNASSLPEVVGDAAVLVEPYDVEGIVARLDQLLSEESLRTRLSEAGLRRSKEFEARQKAAEVLRVFEEVVAGNLV